MKTVKEKCLELLWSSSQTDGSHHKAWVLDQLLRILTECPTIDKTTKDYKGDEYTYKTLGESEEYKEFIKNYENGSDGPQTYQWDVGIAP
jgi:hypothetical protein